LRETWKALQLMSIRFLSFCSDSGERLLANIAKYLLFPERLASGELKSARNHPSVCNPKLTCARFCPAFKMARTSKWARSPLLLECRFGRPNISRNNRYLVCHRGGAEDAYKAETKVSHSEM
jgi:hypothetical protein